MGWVMMSERVHGRIGVLSRVVDGSMNETKAASVLAVSARHSRRMVKRVRGNGFDTVCAGAPRTTRSGLGCAKASCSRCATIMSISARRWRQKNLLERYGMKVLGEDSARLDGLVLSGLRSGLSAHLGGLSFEGEGAFASEHYNRILDFI